VQGSLLATRKMGSHNADALTHGLRRMRHHAGLFISLCTATQAFGATSSSLEIQGQRYANVCLQSQTANLKKMLPAGNAQDTTQAWHIIHTILCAPINEANRTYVRSVIKTGIKKITESTGTEPERKLVRAGEKLASQIMAGGQAGSADIEAEAQTIVLQYYPNGACIRIVKLEYSGAKWIVYEFAEACD
jgi:hypothetical protein